MGGRSLPQTHKIATRLLRGHPLVQVQLRYLSCIFLDIYIQSVKQEANCLAAACFSSTLLVSTKRIVSLLNGFNPM